MMGATTRTIHASTFATASSVSPENIEACTAGAAPSATSGNARRTRFRMAAIGRGARMSCLCSLVLGCDTELDLVEPRCAVRLLQIKPVLLVSQFQGDLGAYIPTHTG